MMDAEKTQKSVEVPFGFVYGSHTVHACCPWRSYIGWKV